MRLADFLKKQGRMLPKITSVPKADVFNLHQMINDIIDEIANLEVDEPLEIDEKDLEDIIDNITEGRLKHLTVYQPSFVGSSKTSMLKYLVQAIKQALQKD